MAEVNLVVCGAAGQGIKTVESLLSELFAGSGRYVFSTKEYMSRIRGGSNSTDLRVSDAPVRCPVRRVDLLVALDVDALRHMRPRMDGRTVVVASGESLAGAGELPGEKLEVDLEGMAEEAGRKVYSNTVAAGVVAGMTGLDRELSSGVVGRHFERLGKEEREGNLSAFGNGYGAAGGMPPGRDLSLPAGDAGGRMLLSGSDAVGMGAVAGNMRFMCSYPMSPSTAVLVFLAGNARRLGLVVEQAEDEISAVNMGLGAWYAGARAMVTTSGGGLALMSEGISLSGMLEIPMVLHVAQRPGPATGLPTRTAQEDLELVLAAGHGEFPRAVLAPGSIEQAFRLTGRALWLAEKHQVPVFVLTDQYLMDSYYQVGREALAPESVPGESFLVDAGADYARYRSDGSPVCSMAVPGTGPGLVVVDSDEHDEEGHITEDLDRRVRMVDRRLAKGEGLAEDSLAPELVGEGDVVVLCWGSTREVCLEAVRRTGRDDLAVLHVSQPWPLHDEVGGILGEAEMVIDVEGNATGQLGRLVAAETGVAPDIRLLRYDGLPFRADTLADRITGALEGSGR